MSLQCVCIIMRWCILIDISVQKKYLEALKKYEEVILLKRDTYGEKSETVSEMSEIDVVPSGKEQSRY